MEKQGNILVVDDNKDILKTIVQILKYEVKKIHTLDNPYNIPSFLSKNDVDVVLLDMNYKIGEESGFEGLFWLEKILKEKKAISIIMITAYGDIDIAVKAVKEGAYDFITKPWDNDKLITTIKNGVALRQSKQKVKELETKQDILKKDIDKNFNEIIGESPKMKEIYKIISKIANTDANVLITGENGTGKELIAREIHRLSNRSSEVLMKVDVGALSDTLFESELFGHVKGAFTDAKEDRTGKIEAANNGTLFLDEIGNLHAGLQSKLLTVLQNKIITRLGSNTEIPVNFRLICATNKNLFEHVKKDLFREDLLYRINTIHINLPPLCERENDIVLLANSFLKEFKNKYNKHSLQYSNKAIDEIQNYKWPGNIRELNHTIEKAVILADDDIIKPQDLFLKGNYTQNATNDGSNKLIDVEKKTIIKVLSKHNGNLTKAAKELDISRTTLYAKMQKYEI